MRIPFFTVLCAHQLIHFIANDSPSLPLHISARSNGFCCALSIIPTKVFHCAAQNRNSIEIMLLFCGMCTRCNSEDGPLEGIEDYWITTLPSTSNTTSMTHLTSYVTHFHLCMTLYSRQRPVLFMLKISIILHRIITGYLVNYM